MMRNDESIKFIKFVYLKVLCTFKLLTHINQNIQKNLNVKKQKRMFASIVQIYQRDNALYIKLIMID